MNISKEVFAMFGFTISAVCASMIYMFTTFATIDQVNDVGYPIYKQQIREIRKEIAKETNPRVKEMLEEDLQAMIDRLCRIAPKDRECQPKK